MRFRVIMHKCKIFSNKFRIGDQIVLVPNVETCCHTPFTATTTDEKEMSCLQSRSSISFQIGIHQPDDQVLITGDEDDASYMLRKLKEQYVKWGLEINFQKIEYLALGEAGNDLSLDNNSKGYTNQFNIWG